MRDASPDLPRPMTLPALQGYVREMVEARGFTRDLNEILILLVEEVGELAREFENSIYFPERFDRRNFSHEIVDVFLYLLDVANGFFLELNPRFGRPDGGSALPALNRLAELPPESGPAPPPGLLVVALAGKIGELATAVRKQWKGRAQPQAVQEPIAAAITLLFRLAAHFQLNFEEALAEKEKLNASRTWAY